MGDIIQYALLAFFAGAILLTMWNDRQENKRMKLELEQKQALVGEQVPNNSAEVQKKGTRDLFLDTLTKLGCQYEFGEGEDNRIYFAYQGENFIADATNEAKFIHLWDTHWGHVDLNDIDEVSRLRKAINKSNLSTAVTTVFTIDEDGKNMDVHTKTIIPFIYSMPNLEEYLRIELNDFFRAHQMIGTEMSKLREKEQNV